MTASAKATTQRMPGGQVIAHRQYCAMPKSMAFRCESASAVANRKFSGFTSLMTTPLAWNWLTVRSTSRTSCAASAEHAQVKAQLQQSGWRTGPAAPTQQGCASIVCG